MKDIFFAYSTQTEVIHLIPDLFVRIFAHFVLHRLHGGMAIRLRNDTIMFSYGLVRFKFLVILVIQWNVSEFERLFKSNLKGP